MEEVYDVAKVRKLQTEGNIISLYKYLIEGVSKKISDKKTDKWEMSDKDEQLLFNLIEVKPHLITDKLNYGLDKALGKDSLRFRDIVAPLLIQ